MTDAGGLRAAAVAALTAALAVAAHGSAGGGWPDSSTGVLLLGTALVVGAAAARRSPVGVLGLLAGGQLAGHLVLGISAHATHTGDGGGAAMLAAHAGAVLLATVLVALATRVVPRCAAALGRVRPRLVLTAPVAERPRVRPVVGRVEVPWTVALVRAVPRRGPPVGV